MSGSLGILDAVVLGLVEGVTEYLPISSTGHLVLARSLLGLDSPEDIRRNVDAFLIVIQGGAILAVLGLYRTSVLRMIRGVFGNDREGLVLFRNLLIAFLPAAILGPLLNGWIEARLMEAGPVLLALSAGGPVLLAGAPEWLRALCASRLVIVIYRTIQQPVIAVILFVGLFWFWLIPPVHFAAMLDHNFFGAF